MVRIDTTLSRFDFEVDPPPVIQEENTLLDAVLSFKVQRIVLPILTMNHLYIENYTWLVIAPTGALIVGADFFGCSLNAFVGVAFTATILSPIGLAEKSISLVALGAMLALVSFLTGQPTPVAVDED